MTITEREYDNIKEMMDEHYKSIENILRLRKDYWDERIDKVCHTVADMKRHCEHQQDQCSIVFREFDRRIGGNANDITKIKTVGSVLMVIWGAAITIVTQFIRKLGG